MDGVPRLELKGDVDIVRFYTPEHNNSLLKQFISYGFFAVNVLLYAYKNRNNYDIVFATSSRLGTGILGFLVSKVLKKPLYLDIRDVLSENLQSFEFLKGTIGEIFINRFSKIESLIISHAKWINFVSPGFFTYPHIKKLNKNIQLFTNGIDDIFLDNRIAMSDSKATKVFQTPIKIVYAGNIGFGQGLELIILPLADYYKGEILFQLIGDGNSVGLIQKGISKNNLKNIQLIPPVNRDILLEYYNDADMFLLHLNDILPSLIRVLPSKIFDYGSFDKPMLAGVQGVAYSFIKEHLPSAHLFNPGDVNSVIKYIDSIIKHGFPLINNDHFIEKFSRENIMELMLNSMVSTNKEYV